MSLFLIPEEARNHGCSVANSEIQWIILWQVQWLHSFYFVLTVFTTVGFGVSRQSSCQGHYGFAEEMFFWNWFSISFVWQILKEGPRLLSWLHCSDFLIIFLSQTSACSGGSMVWTWSDWLRTCLPIHRQRSGMFAARCFWVPLSIVFLASAHLKLRSSQRWPGLAELHPCGNEMLYRTKNPTFKTGTSIFPSDWKVPDFIEAKWLLKWDLGALIYLLFSPSQHSRVGFFIDLILWWFHFQQDFWADDFNGALLTQR